jgi:hypothetical protein
MSQGVRVSRKSRIQMLLALLLPIVAEGANDPQPSRKETLK